MERTNYYGGYAGPNPMNNPPGGTVYAAAGPVEYTSGYKVEQDQHPQYQQAPYRLGNDIGSPTKRKAEQPIYPEQSMRLGTPAADDADGHYEYDTNAYGASRSRNEGGLSAGDYDTTDLNTIRVQNRSGKDVRMVISNHSNMNVPFNQSAGSSITSSNEYAPPTPSGDASGYGYAVGDMHGSADSPPDGQKPAGSIVSNPNSNTASSPTDSSRKKQKRNKPTLSCSECVERKTKCDRGRPHCLSCIKRQTECKYAHVANLLEETSRSAAAAGGRRVTRPLLSKKLPGSSTSLSIPNMADRGILNAHVESLGSVALSTGLLSNVPYSMPSASNVFGIGSEHPFANYWTCEGGLPEVISVLPDKIQSDILLVRYFECFDPVYPMLNQQYFYSEFENFWALAPEEKNMVDPAFIALLFAMLALGTQFVSTTTPKERKQTAEFYASASNQALRLSSYLSSASVRSIQSMVLITYFLINDNHASDGWAFAGILMRQAYAMGLHRDPNIVTPNASPYEKQQRRKVWQAVLLQDTFLTVLLSLPPTATHTDVNVEDLEEEDLIGSSNKNSVTDTAYIRGSWTLANLVQEVISSPRSLDVPICTTSRHKSKMVSDFRAIYRSFPDIFRSWDPESLTQLAKTNKRVVRQTLFLSSNYFHNLMLVHASESTDVPVNVRGTLEAAHDAITSFFVLFKLFESEAGVWWVFNHRAFLEALCIGGVLKEAVLKNSGDAEATAKDPLYARARADIEKMVEIMRIMGEGEQGSEVARTRVKVLLEFL
ncbi:hypothetical protein SBRCBS47491_001455 [Sporothrix bragantina]|uniref:Zn(2)-C6 fungal-type domain-containing protein n=1 Tax=Sporothrix bragantina TaxID=671064 RepID=A0ABP0AZ79_9PEZI